MDDTSEAFLEAAKGGLMDWYEENSNRLLKECPGLSAEEVSIASSLSSRIRKVEFTGGACHVSFDSPESANVAKKLEFGHTGVLQLRPVSAAVAAADEFMVGLLGVLAGVAAIN